MVRNFILLLALTSTFAACSPSPTNIDEIIGDEVPTGGPCSYQTSPFEATITAIEPFRSEDYDNADSTQSDLQDIYSVQLSFNGGTLSAEPQYLEQLLNTTIDSAFIARNNLQYGGTLRGEIKEILEGTCNPMSVSFDTAFQ